MEGNFGNEENFVSLKALKANMKDALKKSGVLSSVKAQVRMEFINNLTPGYIGQKKVLFNELSDEERLLQSAIFFLLRSKGYEYTLSVYTAESGIDKDRMLSEDEVSTKLHLGSCSRGEREKSALALVLNEMNRRRETVCVDSGTQSDYSGVGIREILDSRLGEISRTYESKMEQEKLFPSKGVEERMLAFQQDCEKRMKADLEAQLSSMKEVEISKVRLEEAHKARLELEAMRTELESSFERRMQVQTEREADSLRGAAERERQLQQAQYEARQRLQRELDELRAREQNATKKTELDAQGLRLLESRLKESQLALEHREREVARREREAEHHIREANERAREESRERVREELEALIRERAALQTERTRLDADRSAWDTVVADAASWRSKCTDLETSLAKKEEEIISLKHHIARLEYRQKIEVAEIAQVREICLWIFFLILLWCINIVDWYGHS